MTTTVSEKPIKRSGRQAPSMSRQAWIGRLLDLPGKDRAFLASALIDSLDEDDGFELSKEWKDEISRRWNEIETGKVRLRSAEDVFHEAFAEIG